MSAGLVLGARYRLDTRLGAGGFGSVWRAQDMRLQRAVAVKLLHVVGADIPRFEREAQALASLNHPNVVTVHDFGVDGDVTYLVLELIEGMPVAGELAAAVSAGHVGLPLGRVMDIADQVLDGLCAAHAAGFVHRDLKPDNVMVVGGGPRIKVVDFGIAHAVNLTRMTVSGGIIGTLPYIAPEQLNGDPLDGRADLYSLGCMLHELLSGASPYRATTPASWIQAHHVEPPAHLRDRRPDLPESIDAFIQWLLAKDPSQRPPGAAAARAALAVTISEVSPHAVTQPGTPAAVASTPPATPTTGPEVAAGASTVVRPRNSPAQSSPVSPGAPFSPVPTAGGPPTWSRSTVPGTGTRPGRSRRRWVAAGLLGLAILVAAVLALQLPRGQANASGPGISRSTAPPMSVPVTVEPTVTVTATPTTTRPTAPLPAGGGDCDRDPLKAPPISVTHHATSAATITAVRPGTHPDCGYDRVTFDIGGSTPSYTVTTTTQVLADGSGQPISLPGTTFLLIRFAPARAGALTMTPVVLNYPIMKGYAVAGANEGVVTIALGLSASSRVRVGELSGRIYLDVSR